MTSEIRVVATTEEEEEERNFKVAQGRILEASNILFLALGGHYMEEFTLWQFIEQYTYVLGIILSVCYTPTKMSRTCFPIDTK